MKHLLRHPKKAFGSCPQARIVALDLDVRNRFDRYGNALYGICPLRRERNGNDVEIEILDLFEKRKNERCTAANKAITRGRTVAQFALCGPR